VGIDFKGKAGRARELRSGLGGVRTLAKRRDRTKGKVKRIKVVYQLDEGIVVVVECENLLM